MLLRARGAVVRIQAPAGGVVDASPRLRGCWLAARRVGDGLYRLSVAAGLLCGLFYE